MDWNDRFDRLTATQQLGVAAMSAERVLPLVGSPTLLDDGLRLVWMQISGRATSKQDVARALNAAIDVVRLSASDDSARARAARATFAVLEAAQHNPPAASEAVASALAAAAAVDGAARDEELQWLAWALDIAAEAPQPTRAAFQDASAPGSRWMGRICSADLPLFTANR